MNYAKAKGKPTLKNDEARRKYAEDPANWEGIESSSLKEPEGNPFFRLERLKGTAIFRVCAYEGERSVPDGRGGRIVFRREGYEPIDAFELGDGGCYDPCRSRMSVSRIVQRLKEIRL